MKRLHAMRIPVLPDLIRKYVRVVYACDLPYTAELGEGTRFPHNGLGVVIHERTRIGEQCRIYQHVTIGGDGRPRIPGTQSAPVIGDRVTLYAGAVIGGPITIGDDAVVAANSVVLQSIAANTRVGGIPARPLQSHPPASKIP